MALHNGQTFEHNGHKFRVDIEHDDVQRFPWEECDGEGIVSEWTFRPKAPGERLLHSDHGLHRYYDIRATMKKALKEGWDAAPYTGTRHEKAARAVEASYERMRAWCNDEWSYVGVVVTPLCPHCGEPMESKSESLWGIESDRGDYIEEVAHELADQVYFSATAEV